MRSGKVLKKQHVQGALSDALYALFPNVFITLEIVDEWFHVTVQVKDHAHIDRPERDHKKVLLFLEKTVLPELQPHHLKVVAEWEHYDGRNPRIKAFYGPKWNDFSELSFALHGDTTNGWVARAWFGSCIIEHKTTTGWGLLQKLRQKLKAEVGDVSDADNLRQKGIR